ncbi:MAG: AmmeMemoRadiSam system radical SAM enzyme, partial [Promethearchaeota archaeon]
RPMYKLNAPRTPFETIINACKMAYEDIGLHYVYAGNISTDKYENTYCPKCKNILIKRVGYSLTLKNLTERNFCSNCNTKINIEGKVKTSGKKFLFF